MDDFLIKLQAILDGEKSKENINKSIDRMQHKLDKLKLQATLDPKAAQNLANEIGKLINQKIVISNIGVDTNQTNTAGQQIGTNIAQNVAKGINQSSNKVDSEVQKLADRVNDIKRSIDNGYGASAYQNQINSLINDFQKYGIAAETAKTQTSSLQEIFNDMKNLSGQELVAQADRFEQEFKAVKISIDEAKISYDRLLQPVSSTKQVNLTNKIEKWLMNNTRATKSARQELEFYLKELSSSSVSQEQYVKFSNRLTEIDTEMRSMGKLGKSLFQSLSEGAKKFTSLISGTAIVMRVITTTRQAITTVKDLDTALVDLKKTAKMSASELNNFYLSANDTAKQMGVTTEEILTQAAAWSRLGFNTAETATQMAKLSSQFALISPGLSVDDATSGLVSIMKAYDISVSDVLDGIESKVNIIGNNLALSNANIVKMLQDSVSAMAEGRNTLEETIALEAAAYEITQNESVGNGFKTVSLRLRGMNEETEELDESLKTIKGDLYELTGVSIMENENTYKSTYQILKEISEVWDSLTDTARSDALELMFGKQRSNIGAAVLKNFSAAERAMDLMADSAGNADAELSVAMDSIEYKMNRLAETGTSVAQSLFQRDDMKTVIDGLTSIAEVIDKVTNKLGLFGSIGLGTGITAFVKNFA